MVQLAIQDGASDGVFRVSGPVEGKHYQAFDISYVAQGAIKVSQRIEADGDPEDFGYRPFHLIPSSSSDGKELSIDWAWGPQKEYSCPWKIWIENEKVFLRLE